MKSLDSVISQGEGHHLSPEKQELLELEKEGTYVFHGSAEEIDLFEPRQAVDTESGPDGEPAVFAAPTVDFAIFHAIINGRNFPEHGIISSSGAIAHDDGSYELKFGLPKGSLDRLPDSATGWVYVFKKNDFAPIPGRPAEFESRSPVQALQKIRVSKKDLPEGIGILNS